MTNFVRRIDEIQKLKTALNNDAFLSKVTKNYVEEGKAFLAIRNKEVTIYINGNQLCNARETQGYMPKIYRKYLPLLLNEGKNKERVFNEKDWLEETGLNEVTKKKYTFEQLMPEILININHETSPESLQVSALYKFSPMQKTNSSKIILLDVESEFASPNEKTNRIDVVMYHTENRQLIFAEVKRLTDGRLYGQITDQMKGYATVIKSEKDNILRQYNKVIGYYNELSTRNIQEIDPNKDILLGLWIVEYKNQDKDIIKQLKGELSPDIPVSSIGNMTNITERTLLNKTYIDFIRK